MLRTGRSPQPPVAREGRDHGIGKKQRVTPRLGVFGRLQVPLPERTI